MDLDWKEIPQTTSAPFQSSAIEIGYRIQYQACMESSFVYTCQTDQIVQADPSLFQAAKKSKSQRVKFHSLKRGANATGRYFSYQAQSMN